MKILIIGSGGREHALAWQLAQSPRVTEIFVAPGNGGTDNPAQKMVNVTVPQAELGDFAVEQQIDLTVVGPEAPLADGIVDQFQARGLSIWGPTQAAAQLEASKAFAKAFMARHNIPTAEYATFDEFDGAQAYLQQKMQAGQSIVIKASGLAAGKGVILPDSSNFQVSRMSQKRALRVAFCGEREPVFWGGQGPGSPLYSDSCRIDMRGGSTSQI